MGSTDGYRQVPRWVLLIRDTYHGPASGCDLPVCSRSLRLPLDPSSLYGNRQVYSIVLDTLLCRDIFIKLSYLRRGGGEFEIVDLFFYQFWTFWKKLWTFQYAAGLRDPGILIKRSTIVDLSVYAAWLRGPDISQNIQKRIKKYPKSRLPSFHI